MHYVLIVPPICNEKGELLVELHNYYDVGEVWNFGCGKPLEADEIASIPNPVEITMERFQGYEGLPIPVRDNGIPIMCKALKETLEEAGVENIDYYPVRLIDKQLSRDYEYYIYSIKVKAPTVYQGPLVYRLTEQLGTILVDESICDKINRKNIEGVSFMRPEDYVQI